MVYKKTYRGFVIKIYSEEDKRKFGGDVFRYNYLSQIEAEDTGEYESRKVYSGCNPCEAYISAIDAIDEKLRLLEFEKYGIIKNEAIENMYKKYLEENFDKD